MSRQPPSFLDFIANDVGKPGKEQRHNTHANVGRGLAAATPTSVVPRAIDEPVVVFVCGAGSIASTIITHLEVVPPPKVTVAELSVDDTISYSCESPCVCGC